jgi:CrcB protein
LIGVFWAFNEKEPFAPETAAFLFIGLLGAFTTFSTYSLDSLRLFQDGRIFAATAYIVGNNVGAIGGAALGYLAGKMISGP